MLRDLKIMAAGGRPSKLFDMMIESLQGIQLHKERISELEEQIREMELAHVRNARDLIDNFVAAMEYEDQDEVRDAMENALVDLNDHVARLEEHSST